LIYKVVENKANQRFAAWYDFRQQLETSPSPFDDVHAYFHNMQTVKVYTDPYDQSTWPTPWELIEENEYCKFNLILAVCYTLQLTNRFKQTLPKIKIAIDKRDKTVYYLLYMDDKVYGYDYDGWISCNNLPKTLIELKIYAMPSIH
jgi:hypothetical protein